MGFIDSFSDAVNKALDKAASPETKEAVDRITEVIGEKVNSFIDGISGFAPDFANAPSRAKPLTVRFYELYFFDENGKDYKVKASFSLSGDFVESKTNAGEIDAIYLYDPDCTDMFVPFGANETRPYFMIAPDIDEVYCSVKEYLECGKVKSAIWLQPSDHPNMLFRAKFEYYGDYMVMYGYQRSDCSPGGMCLVYKKAIDGSALCGKLLTQLEEAAGSYREEKLEM